MIKVRGRSPPCFLEVKFCIWNSPHNATLVIAKQNLTSLTSLSAVKSHEKLSNSLLFFLTGHNNSRERKLSAQCLIYVGEALIPFRQIPYIHKVRSTFPLKGCLSTINHVLFPVQVDTSIMHGEEIKILKGLSEKKNSVLISCSEMCKFTKEKRKHGGLFLEKMWIVYSKKIK